MNLDQVIIKPLLSEKTTTETKFNRYFFRVNRLSNKNQIKRAIEKIFKVKVNKVRTVNLKGKTKRSSSDRRIYRTSDLKKAMVELKKGEKISLFEIKENQSHQKREKKVKPAK